MEDIFLKTHVVNLDRFRDACRLSELPVTDSSSEDDDDLNRVLPLTSRTVQSLCVSESTLSSRPRHLVFIKDLDFIPPSVKIKAGELATMRNVFSFC